MEHSGGHLPFKVELRLGSLVMDGPNRITVAVNNTLTPDTVPQGEVKHETAPRCEKTHNSKL